MLGTTRLAASALALGAALMLAAGVASAQAATTPPAEAEGDDSLDPDTLDTTSKALGFLRQQQRFSFSAETGYEVVQDDGERLEFGSVKRYTVQRPSRLRIESEERDGDQRLIVFDGTTFTIAAPTDKAYAQAAVEKPRDIDEMIDLVRDRLDTPLPLSELLRNDPRKAIEDSLESAYTVGTEKLGGVACDHLAFRNPDADVQIWFAQGAQPVPRRIIITYRNVEGQPSFWADLSDWSFAPKLSDATFAYVPPEGTARIRFAARPPPEDRVPVPIEGGAK